MSSRRGRPKLRCAEPPVDLCDDDDDGPHGVSPTDTVPDVHAHAVAASAANARSQTCGDTGFTQAGVDLDREVDELLQDTAGTRLAHTAETTRILELRTQHAAQHEANMHALSSPRDPGTGSVPELVTACASSRETSPPPGLLPITADQAHERRADQLASQLWDDAHLDVPLNRYLHPLWDAHRIERLRAAPPPAPQLPTAARTRSRSPVPAKQPSVVQTSPAPVRANVSALPPPPVQATSPVPAQGASPEQAKSPVHAKRASPEAAQSPVPAKRASPEEAKSPVTAKGASPMQATSPVPAKNPPTLQATSPVPAKSPSPVQAQSPKASKLTLALAKEQRAASPKAKAHAAQRAGVKAPTGRQLATVNYAKEKGISEELAEQEVEASEEGIEYWAGRGLDFTPRGGATQQFVRALPHANASVAPVHYYMEAFLAKGPQSF